MKITCTNCNHIFDNPKEETTPMRMRGPSYDTTIAVAKCPKCKAKFRIRYSDT